MGFFRQHERLRVPQFWKGEEKSFVTQLEKLLDQLFNRKVGENDVDPKFLSNIFTKKPVKLASGDDCNNCTESGLYYITTGVSHSPANWCGMLVINSGHAENRDFYQLMFTETGIWVRAYAGNPPSWRPWREMRGTYSIPGRIVTVQQRAMGYGYVTSAGT